MLSAGGRGAKRKAGRPRRDCAPTPGDRPVGFEKGVIMSF